MPPPEALRRKGRAPLSLPPSPPVAPKPRGAIDDAMDRSAATASPPEEDGREIRRAPADGARVAAAAEEGGPPVEGRRRAGTLDMSDGWGRGENEKIRADRGGGLSLAAVAKGGTLGILQTLVHGRCKTGSISISISLLPFSDQHGLCAARRRQLGARAEGAGSGFGGGGGGGSAHSLPSSSTPFPGDAPTWPRFQYHKFSKEKERYLWKGGKDSNGRCDDGHCGFFPVVVA